MPETIIDFDNPMLALVYGFRLGVLISTVVALWLLYSSAGPLLRALDNFVWWVGQYENRDGAWFGCLRALVLSLFWGVMFCVGAYITVTLMYAVAAAFALPWYDFRVLLPALGVGLLAAGAGFLEGRIPSVRPRQKELQPAE